jgi:hypothetical protein
MKSGIYFSNTLTHFLLVMIVDLFEEKVFSERGSSSFEKEQTTYIFFRDLLEEIEGRK